MEHRTLDVFRRALVASGLTAGEVVAVLSESTSRAALVDAARRAAEPLTEITPDPRSARRA